MRLVKAELYKFFKGNVIRVLALIAGVYVAVQCSSLISKMYIKIGMMEESDQIPIYGYNSVELSELTSIFTFFIPFLIVFFFTSEFSKKTFGNLIRPKINKEKLFFSKFIAFSVVVLLFASYFSFLSTIIATCVNGWGISFNISQLFEIIGFIFRVTLVQIASASLLIIVSMFLHNDALIVILFFVISLVESIITSLISRINFNSGFVLFLIHSLPSNCVDKFQMLNIDSNTMWNGLFYTISSIILCVVLGNKIIKKIDINY